MVARSALAVVTDYIEQIWNAGRDELITDLCADPIVRHDPNAVTRLSHAEQRARIRHNYDTLDTRFTWEVLAGDDRHVTLVWNVTGRDPAWRLCGIEIFRVDGGQITDVWNLPYAHGRWGQAKALLGRVGDSAAVALPIMGIELADDSAQITVPVDTEQLPRWLERLFGPPVTAGTQSHFSGDPLGLAPLTLTITDPETAPRALAAAEVAAISIELAETGLVNATLSVTGTPGAATAAPSAEPAVTRLSRTIGALMRGATHIGQVIDGSVAFERGGTQAHGRVTLRLAPGITADDVAGAGSLTIGWSEGDASLIFAAEAMLDRPSHSFAETAVTATCTWHAPRVTAPIHGLTLQPIGAGNVSDTARLVVETGDGRLSMVAKFRPRSDAVHAHGIGSGAYRCETEAYRLFAATSDGCRTPRILWLAGGDENINLVMEDLSTVTRAGDQIAGCSPGDAAAVVTQLARLHRAHWPLTDRAAPAWLLRMPACGDYWAASTAAGALQVERRFAADLTDEHHAIVRAAGPLSRAWHDLPHAAMTITHGDPRVDNILFDDRSGTAEAILIDWQVTGLRHPMHDVGYFLSGSVLTEDRRVCERSLLAAYIETVGARATLPVMIDAYRIQLISGLMTTLAAVALLPDEPRANCLLLTLLARNCAAVADWESLDALINA